MELINVVGSTDRARQEAMNLALTSAINKSNRSGFGWVLLDNLGKCLTSGSFIVGKSTNNAEIIASIKNYCHDITHLIITCDPVIALLDTTALSAAVEDSRCQTLTVGYHLSLVTNLKWQSWQKEWSGKVYHLPPTQITERLNAGPKKVLTKTYPWLTGVSISAISGHSMALSDLSHEFGFNAFLRELANKSRAVMYTASQYEIVKALDSHNFGQEENCFIKVDTITSVIDALMQCAQQKRTNVLLLCDLRLLKDVISENLCDEIIHHIGFESVVQEDSELQPVLSPFENWSIISSEVIGQCVRLTLGHLNDIKHLSPSGTRLN